MNKHLKWDNIEWLHDVEEKNHMYYVSPVQYGEIIALAGSCIFMCQKWVKNIA